VIASPTGQSMAAFIKIFDLAVVTLIFTALT